MEEERKKQINKLSGFTKTNLLRLVHIFSGDEIDGKKPELAKVLVDNHQGEISEFLENLKKLSFAQPYIARDFLRDLYPDKSQEIADIRRKHQILIFLYENNLIDKLEQVSFYCSFRGKELRNTYNLKTKTDLDYEQIVGKLSEFTSTWNEGKQLMVSTTHYTTADEKLVISILREHNQKTYSQFSFRDNQYDTSNNPSRFKLNPIKIFPVWPERMEFNKIGKGKYEIVFDFDPLSESSILNCFINSVFGPGSELEKTEIKSVKEIQTEIKESMKKSPKWEEIDKLISKRKPPVIAKINADTTLSMERKTKIIGIVDSIQYAGPSLKDDPKTTTRELTMKIGNISTLFSVITSAKGFLQEFFSKVSKSTDNQNIYINNKSVLLTKGSMKFSTRLSEDEKIALKLFLGEE